MSQQIEDTAGDAGTPTEQQRLDAAVAALSGIGEPELEGQEATLETPAPVEAQAAAPQSQPPAGDAAPSDAPAQREQLAEVIRAQRADRQARAVKEREAADLRTQLDDARAQLAKLSKADLLADPLGFAQAHGLTNEEMVLVGQAYLYHLVPDKAPPDLRYKMLEAKSAREQKAREADRQAQASKAAQDAEAQQIRQYTAVLGVAVETWAGSAEQPFPSSQAWFGGNHDEYAESLVHTARNIAEAAEARGEVADLSPKAVAAVLEQDIASRASRFRPPAAAPNQPSVKEPPAKPTSGGKQPAVMSTRGQGGAPVPPAETEEERLRRAIAVLDNR